MHQLTVEAISTGLDTLRVGRRMTVLDEVGSTNTHALDVVARSDGSASDGHVIFAEYQTAGRGRLGRSWHSPRGASLTFTTLLWEPSAALPTARIIMAAAVAVARGIESSTDIDPLIRWPNDIYVKDRKLAGILVEARANGPGPLPVAIGIGVNCLQQTAHLPVELRDRATSLEIESRHAVDRAAVARAILRELDRLFANESAISDDAIAAQWRDRSVDAGTRVTLTCNGETFSGHVVDINPRSGLLLQLDSGLRREFDLATISRQ